MTNEQLLRYFEKRPKAKEIHLVGKVVFSDKEAADKYAAQVNGTVDTKNKKELQEAFAQEKLNLPKLSKSEAEGKLKGMTLSKQSDYIVLGSLVEALELTTDGKSKKAYLAALKAVQETLIANGSSDDITPDPEAEEETDGGSDDEQPENEHPESAE